MRYGMNKKAVIAARATPEQRDLVDAISKGRGITAADFIREAVDSAVAKSQSSMPESRKEEIVRGLTPAVQEQRDSNAELLQAISALHTRLDRLENGGAR